MSCLSYVSDLSKLGALLHKIHSKVLLVLLGTSNNLLFSQRNKATKKAVGVKVGMRRGGSQNFKKGGLDNIRGSLKRGG